MVFRVNAGSSRNPLVQRLLRLLAKQITRWGITPLADWNDREQDDARHADRLSKTFMTKQWQSTQTSTQTGKAWLFDIIIHDLATGNAVVAVFRVPSMN